MIGLIGGLGVGATVHYYRELAQTLDANGTSLQLAMVHTQISKVSEYLSAGNRQALALYLAGTMTKLKAAGATIGVVPAIAPHMCIDELNAVSPIPVLDLIAVVKREIEQRRLHRVALFGTKFVVETDMFGKLSNVDIIRPRAEEIALVHDTYFQLARTGTAPGEQREGLIQLARTLQTRDRVDAIVLAGTDFVAMFGKSDTPFPSVDCAGAHIRAIAEMQ